MTTLLGILAATLLYAYIVIPIRLRSTFRISAHPELEEVSPNDKRIPEPVRAFFGDVAADLAAVYFSPVVHLIDSDTWPRATGYIALFYNRSAGDQAAAIAAFVKAAPGRIRASYAVEFSTRFADGREVNTNNITESPSLASLAWSETERIPAMAGLGQLFEVHQARTARHGRSSEKHVPREGVHTTEFRDGILRVFEGQVEAGYLCPEPGGEAYRPTWKGGLLMAWGQLWPMSAIRRRLAKRRARALLRELNLPADYTTIDYRAHYKRRNLPAEDTPVSPTESSDMAPLAPGESTFACPACGGLIATEEDPGVQVRCPLCEQAVTVPSPGPPPVIEDVDERAGAPIVLEPVRRGLATGALVCGLIGVFTACFPVGLVGLILGIVAVVRASRQPERYGGKGLAIGGICTGAVSLVLVSLLAVVLIMTLGASWVCEVNLQDINDAMVVYADANDGAFPPDFETLIRDGSLSEIDFWCPKSDPSSDDPYECYQYVAGQTTRDDPDNVLIYEKPECHDGEGGSVLFVDGRVEFIEPYSQVEDLLRQTREAQSAPAPNR
ncbi:MAG: DUF4190 domain-containing protein [Planctomycetota bacterium]